MLRLMPHCEPRHVAFARSVRGSYSPLGAANAVKVAFDSSCQVRRAAHQAMLELSKRLDAVQNYVAEAIG